jgi:hypothetical protein
MKKYAAIYTEVLPEAFRWTPQNPLSGTTKSYVRVAEELAKRGYTVHVEYDGPAQVHNDVLYGGRVAFERDAHNLVIDMNYTGPVGSVATTGGACLQWTSLYNRPDLCNGLGSDGVPYRGLVIISDFIASTLSHAAKCPLVVNELGCDEAVLTDPEPRGDVCCYTSSPDRGGHFLQEMWPRVEAATGYRLECSAYGDEFTPEQMTALYRRSRFWVYPALGTDSVLSTLEAQANGCIPFYVPHMGLPETVRYGASSDLFRFEANLIQMLNDYKAPGRWDGAMLVRSTMLKSRPIPTWAQYVDRLLSAAGVA